MSSEQEVHEQLHNVGAAGLTSLLDWIHDELSGGTFGGTTAVMKSVSQEILLMLGLVK